MTFSTTTVATLVIGYLGAIAVLSRVSANSPKLSALSQGPIIYMLSLSTMVSGWIYFGVTDLAFRYGYGALTFCFGISAAFLFANIAIAPLAQLARRFQIATIADLFVFRYHSQAAGALVTLLQMVASVILIAAQLIVLSDVAEILTLDMDKTYTPNAIDFSFGDFITLVYAAIIGAIGCTYGANWDRYSLSNVLALEAIIKLIAILAVGFVAVFVVFNGLDGIDAWLTEYPDNQAMLYKPSSGEDSNILLFLFFAATLSVPQCFNIHQVNAPIQQTTNFISWSFPFYLLVMALPIFPILWAGFELNVPLPAQYFALGIPMALDWDWLVIVVLLGGLAAISGATLTFTLSLTTTLLNHWLIPLSNFQERDLYRQLRWMRRALILMILLAGYIVYLSTKHHHTLIELGLMALIGPLQLLPGIIAISFWHRGNRKGLIAGLFAGASIWLSCVVAPLLMGWDSFTLPIIEQQIPIGIEKWSLYAILSLSLNSILFYLISRFSEVSADERYSADICTEDELSYPMRTVLDVYSAEEFIPRLAIRLGQKTAETEVNRALSELGMTLGEKRPFALRQLREQIEANLSGLMGTTVAGELLDRYVPFLLPEGKGSADINLIESRLHTFRHYLTGLAGELNNLRLYHRNTLEELPMAVCSVGLDREILMWNRAMVLLTGIETNDVVGSLINDIPAPWNRLLTGFMEGDINHVHGKEVSLDKDIRWLNLHRSTIPDPATQEINSHVLMLEDCTETQRLEKKLIHSERLASVGRLAAGVAHEIGNPVTGIACLAQNLKYESSDPEISQYSADILSQTDRISAIVQSLMSFSHSDQHSTLKKASVSVFDCADEAIGLLSLQKDRQEVRFINQCPKDLHVKAHFQQLIQVFINLLSNARDASQQGDPITVNGYEDNTQVIITVTDCGSGIPADKIDQIMEPFVTTKDIGQGTGLGLSLSYSIIENHGGSISVKSPAPNQQNGCEFKIKLPI